MTLKSTVTSGYFWLNAWTCDRSPPNTSSPKPHTVRVPLWAAARGAAVKPRVDPNAPAAASAEVDRNRLRVMLIATSSLHELWAIGYRLLALDGSELRTPDLPLPTLHLPSLPSRAT